jgi:hypothetical protein
VVKIASTGVKDSQHSWVQIAGIAGTDSQQRWYRQPAQEGQTASTGGTDSQKGGTDSQDKLYRRPVKVVRTASRMVKTANIVFLTKKEWK